MHQGRLHFIKKSLIILSRLTKEIHDPTDFSGYARVGGLIVSKLEPTNHDGNIRQ